MTDEKRFNAGDVIYREGEEATSFFIIKSGTVRLLKVNDEEERMIVVSNLYEKDVFGSEDIFKKSTYSTYAVALEAVELVEITANDVNMQIKSMPNWIGEILALLSNRLNDTESILVQHKIYHSSLNDELVIDDQVEAKIKSAILDVVS